MNLDSLPAVPPSGPAGFAHPPRVNGSILPFMLPERHDSEGVRSAWGFVPDSSAAPGEAPDAWYGGPHRASSSARCEPGGRGRIVFCGLTRGDLGAGLDLSSELPPCSRMPASAIRPTDARGRLLTADWTAFQLQLPDPVLPSVPKAPSFSRSVLMLCACSFLRLLPVTEAPTLDV